VQNDPFLWSGDLSQPAGFEIEIAGHPRQINSTFGMALEFDGEKDGILFPANPIAGWTKFTIEVIFRPDCGGQVEQRFLHFGECHAERLLFETRVVDDEVWHLDTFLASSLGSRTLMNKGFHHPLEEWHHAALTFDGSRMTNYVNGQPELSGTVEFTPLQGGKTSIGMRQNKVSWFKGILGTIRATPWILEPGEFLILK
jgi:hypothetical protein